MAMEMSVRSMKSNSVSGIMAEYPDIVTYRKTSLEKISPQLSFCSIKLSLFHSIFLLIAVVKSPFCHFFLKNCGEIFSNVVFLLVLIGSYPAMMPVSQLDFMLLTDISKVVWNLFACKCSSCRPETRNIPAVSSTRSSLSMLTQVTPAPQGSPSLSSHQFLSSHLIPFSSSLKPSWQAHM